MNIFKKLFKKKEDAQPKYSLPKSVDKKKSVVIKDINKLDDVWIKWNDVVYDGWVVEKTDTLLDVVFTNSKGKIESIAFEITDDSDDYIFNNDKKLLLRHP